MALLRDRKVYHNSQDRQFSRYRSILFLAILRYTQHHTPTKMMETEAIRENTSPRTKGLLGRLRRNKNPERSSGKSQVSASPIASVSAGQSVTREGVPVLTSKNADQFNPSDAHQTEPSPKVGVFRRKNRTRQEMILEKPPAARESAFSGPPRYDWIDIVSTIVVPLLLVVVG